MLNLKAYFEKFSSQFEGLTPFIYLDTDTPKLLNTESNQMAIRYSKVTMNLNCGGTIYSEGKGNTIIRQGDTLFISHDAYARVINVPWVSVAEADVMKFSAEDDFKSFCDKHFKPNSTEPKNTSIAGPKSNCIYCRICGQSDSNHPNSRCQIFSQ